MSKPLTNFLNRQRENLESRLAALPLASPEFTHCLDTYERVQFISITEHLEEDLLAATGPHRERLYAQFLRFAALRERTTARQQREKAALLRAQERDKREQLLAARRAQQAQQLLQRAQQRASRSKTCALQESAVRTARLTPGNPPHSESRASRPAQSAASITNPASNDAQVVARAAGCAA